MPSTHAPTQYRPWHDRQIWTHVFFVPGLLVAWSRVAELFCLLVVVLVLSIMNHANFERPGMLSNVEGACAKALYVYGTVQMLVAPDVVARALQMLGFVLTSGVHAHLCLSQAYERDHATWYRWHPIGLHVVPGLWTCVTACLNAPLYF